MLLIAAALFAVNLARSRPEFDHRMIQMERQGRHALASFGLMLPGTPDLDRLDERLAAAGVKLGVPIFLRIFKREFELELWVQRDGTFRHFATYPICRWSGKLGPKLATGDHQAPEGFYTVDAQQLNPNSRWHRSFNLGFPNAFDKAHARTGSFLMVHGGCSSVGCYAMTDKAIDEIWRIVTAALEAGQPRFQVQVFPFRMTDAHLAYYGDRPDAAFWRNLKEGYDLFEQRKVPPRTSVCDRSYSFAPGSSAPDGSAPVEIRCPTSKAGA